MNAVNGLCTVIDMFLHTSILSTERVKDMFRNLLRIYFKKIGTADPDHMVDVLIIRMQQHMEEIRECSIDKNTQLHALRHWNGTKRK